MKVDKEVLLKQHFWLLLILVVVLPLVCLLILWTSASAKVEDAEKTVKGVEQKLTNITAPKNQKFEDVLKEKDQKVDAQKTKIWEAAWKDQADMFTWPESLEGADKLKQMYFGDPMIVDWRMDYYKKNPYQAQYDSNIEIVLPVKDPTTGQVQFQGGPEAVVPVSLKGEFGQRPPDADELWFLQEDLAIQRELLRIIKDTNDMIATFRKVPGAVKTDKSKGEIDHQVFTNSEFKLDLALAEEKGTKVFRCVLTNISNRRQALSNIPFIVYVKGLQDFQIFNADGEPLAPNASVAVKHKEKDTEKDWVLQTQSGNLQGEVLQGVMQVYDWRTAPIKRIDKVAMGISSSRTAGPLLPPLFEKAAEPAPVLGGDMGGGPGGAQGNQPGMERMGRMAGEMARGGFGGGGGSADKTKNGLEKKRYLSVSKQVRRMPVALAIVMDQAHIQDFLTVAANSKLRIQTTQVYWQRFHDDIKPTFKDEGDPQEAKPGEELPGRRPPSSTGRGGMAGKGAMMDRPGMASPGGNIGAMMGTMQKRMQMARMGMGMGMRGKGMGMEMGGGDFPRGSMPRAGMTMPAGSAYAPQAAPDTIEPEEESSLVHLAFYGIVSLYERYPPKKEGTEVATSNP